MTITEMLGQSGLLTLLGMCVVFGFIIVLILCMKLLQIVVHAFKMDKEEAPEATKVSTPAATKPAGDDSAIIAAIAAAAHDRALKL